MRHFLYQFSNILETISNGPGVSTWTFFNMFVHKYRHPGARGAPRFYKNIEKSMFLTFLAGLGTLFFFLRIPHEKILIRILMSQILKNSTTFFSPGKYFLSLPGSDFGGWCPWNDHTWIKEWAQDNRPGPIYRFKWIHEMSLGPHAGLFFRRSRN